MTPYFIYIFLAYGISLMSLVSFLGWTLIQLKQSSVAIRDSVRET